MSRLVNRIIAFGKISEEENFDIQIKQWFPIAIIIGFVVGLVMGIFHIIIVMIGKLAVLLHPIILMISSSLVILFLYTRKFENPKNNGITYVITKRHQEELIPFDVGSKKFVTSSLSIGSGMPIGKEGPALIIGSAIAGKIVRWAKIPENLQHQAITLGSAASTGALFQAPFGSAVFACEVPYKEDADAPFLTAAFLSSVVASVTAKSLVQFYSSHITDVSFHLINNHKAALDINFYTVFLAMVLGVLTGLVGRLFIEFYDFFQKRLQNYSAEQALAIGLGGFVGTMLVGVLLIPDLYLWNGISQFQEINGLFDSIENEVIYVLILLIIFQILATTFIVGSGYPGGVFAPSLLVGALVGFLFASALNHNDPAIIGAWIIISMSAAHAATTKTPIASVLLILEITGLPNLVIPMILANVCAFIMSGPRSLYAGQLRSRDALIMRELKNYDQHEGFTVQDVMTKITKVDFFTVEDTYGSIVSRDDIDEYHDHPVVNSKDDMKLVGMVYEQNMIRAEEDSNPDLKVTEFLEKKFPVLYGDLTGKQALGLMLDYDVERAPVQDRDGNMIGMLSLRDIIRGHRTMLGIEDTTA